MNKNNLLVPIYEIITGLFESTIGIGLMLYEQKMFRLYIELRYSGFFGSYHDLVISLTEKFIPYILSHRLFVGVFLVLIGIIKIISAFGLIYKKHWANSLLTGLLVIFLPFDIAGIVHHPSALKILFFLINLLLILYLTTPKTINSLRKKSNI